MKEVIRVFPDYCSSGLWHGRDGANMDEEEFLDVLNRADLIALKYWHSAWEWSMDSVEGCSLSKRWQENWEQDGQLLVNLWNAKQDKYQFVYVGDNF